MTGDTPSGSGNGTPAADETAALRTLGADVGTALRSMATVLRQQVRRLEIALGALDGHDVQTTARLDALRLTADRLESVLQRGESEAGAGASAPAGPLAPPSGAGRQAGIPTVTMPEAANRAASCHVVQIEIRRPHLRALMESGALRGIDVVDSREVQRVLQSMLDRWSGLYGASARRTTDQQARQERRSTGDRRHSGPRANCLLSYIAGSPMDRRRNLDRRNNSAATGATAPADASAQGQTGAPPMPSAPNLVRFADARVARPAPVRMRPARTESSPGVLPFRAGARSATAAPDPIRAAEGGSRADAGGTGELRRAEGLAERCCGEDEGRQGDGLPPSDAREPDLTGSGDQDGRS